MIVKELIEFLQDCPQDMLIAYKFCSDWALMEMRDIDTVEACEPRADGYIQDKRPDRPIVKYLLFPGN